MQALLAIVLIVVGVFLALAGLVAAADPEGRGGRIIELFYAGIVIAVIGAGWLLWLGWRFFSSLPVF